MRVIRPLASVLGLSAVLASVAAAQARPSPAAAAVSSAPFEPAPKPFVFGMTANAMSINSATASQQMVKPTSWGMQFDAGMSFARYLFASVDFGPQILSDRANFTQTTTAGDMSSTASLVYFSAMAGVRSPALRLIPGLPATSFGMYGGGSGTSGKRSIDKCVNCYSEGISIPGGSFVQPTLVLGEGHARMRVSDRYFTSGTGIRSVISLGMELGGR